MLHTRLKAALLWTLIAACGVQAQDSYSEKIEAWRAEREARENAGDQMAGQPNDHQPQENEDEEEPYHHGGQSMRGHSPG